MRLLDITPDELPRQFPSPFAREEPHPVARRAAEALLAELPALGIDVRALDAPGGGKMFGVLVVEDREGRIGYLRAFSGMFDGAWTLPGFEPPLFDLAARDAMWPQGQAALRTYELELRALAADPAVHAARVALLAHDARVARELEAMRTRHREQREHRKVARRVAGADLHALDQASRGDTAERKRFDADAADRRARLAAIVDELAHRRASLERARADESRELMKQVHDQYVIANARGETRGLRALFAPGEPAAGAGDCAGPKLLGAAYRQGLVPRALAEVWVGAPPATGGRHAGTFYPSCRGKCGPILPFMLEGLSLAGAPMYGAAPEANERVVFEDAWIVVVDKPVGLLSVPGRGGGLRDSVQTRLRARYPDATGPLVVHRLDLDTSGLLLAAKDEDVHTALQAQFARREVDKRYIALLDGEVAGEHGTIDLALRVDLDDRPRQLHDPVLGKPARTEWRVLARASGRTRVAFTPRTGRTHQLRVHAAHAQGLGAPIVGDRLYGRRDDEASRLMLHAEVLAFVHPRSGQRVEFVAPAPF
ncbi:MAG: RluA family pseudouridine synthase [Kofleriaceae bacterium]|nr:RluA family pseudouridine synthase [Kofleriaceae bacterium]